MKAWEYIREESEVSKPIDVCNAFGPSGWELVHTQTMHSGNIEYIFKRPKTHELFSLLRHMIEYYYENGGINRELMVRLDDMIEE